MTKLSDSPARPVSGKTKRYGAAGQRSISYYETGDKREGALDRSLVFPAELSWRPVGVPADAVEDADILADIDLEDLNNIRWIKKRSKTHKTVNCQLLLDIARRKIDGRSPVVEQLFTVLITWLQSQMPERDFVIFNLRATGEISKHKKEPREYSKFIALGHELVLPSSFWNDDCHSAFVKFPLC